MLTDYEIAEAERLLRFDEYRRSLDMERKERKKVQDWDQLCPKCGGVAECEGTLDEGVEVWSCPGCGASIDVRVEKRRFVDTYSFS